MNIYISECTYTSSISHRLSIQIALANPPAPALYVNCRSFDVCNCQTNWSLYDFLPQWRQDITISWTYAPAKTDMATSQESEISSWLLR